MREIRAEQHVVGTDRIAQARQIVPDPDQRLLERTKRHLLQCELVNINLYAFYLKWYGDANTNHQRPDRRLPSRLVNGGYYDNGTTPCQSGFSNRYQM